MKSGTVRFIIILVAMLFLNIEAAQAGLVYKLKLYISHQFPDYDLLFVSGGLFVLGFFSYVLFAPVIIGNEKWAWLNYYYYQPRRNKYSNKRASVRKISNILNDPGFNKEAHS